MNDNTSLHSSVEENPIQRAYQHPQNSTDTTRTTPQQNNNMTSSIPFYSSKAKAKNSVAPLNTVTNRHHKPQNGTQKVKKEASLSGFRNSKNYYVSLLNRLANSSSMADETDSK